MNKDIARKLLEAENLPTLPAIMNHLLEAVDNENTTAQDLTAILERDVAISARILRLANSAFYGLRFKVDTIRRAVVVVGFQAVRMLALATSVFDTLSRHRQIALDPEDFWLHSLGTAKAAQLLAKDLPGVESAEGCFAAGLLLDIGKYALALALKDEYAAIVENAKERGIPLQQAETDALGISYAQAGQWLAEKWRLPEMFCVVIANHNHPNSYHGSYRAEAQMMAVASDIAHVAGFGAAGENILPTPDAAALASLGAHPEVLEQVMEETRQYAEEARRFLEILGGN